MTLNIKQGIYLAALLHDIGKFWQRGSKYDETLSVQTKNMESDLCPVWNSRYSHKHVLWTSEFFEQYTKYIPQSFNRDGELESIANLSAKHHKKASGQTEWERIISYADRLSSGQDRRPDEIGVDTSGSQQRYDFKKIPLQNIFDNLFKVEESNKQSWHILSPLTTNDDIFAKKSDKLSRDLQPDYENLWKSFTDELPNLPLHNFSQYVSTLLPLLEKYCWCIPSSTIDQPDVSLFDHLKTTAAIATSLYDSIETHGSLPSTYDGMKNENKDRFILLSADFSGIQKFIYQITSKGAAKTLKGRSFYLQLIMDMMITHILEVFDVEKAHILLAGGGGFRLLLPNNETKIKEIENFIDDVNKQIWDLYDGKLYVALATLPFKPSILLRNDGYTELVDEIQSKLEKEKYRRFARTIDAIFFEPPPLKGVTASDVCKVTGTDLTEDQKSTKKFDNNEEGTISKSVAEQIELGKQLRNARVMIKWRGRNAKRDIEFSPLDQNITYSFVTDEEIQEGLLSRLIRQPQISEIIWFNKPESFMKVSSPDSSYSSGFMFYGSNWTPGTVYNDESKTYIPIQDRVPDFEEIADDRGRNNDLGILRMDVDNLGNTFKNGFISGKAENNASISRISTLSNRITWFFGGYLDHLIRSDFTIPQKFNAASDQLGNETVLNEELRAHILPIYAGGDDLFIVTRWDIAPFLAKRIHDDLQKFSNGKLTVSAGIAVTSNKYPIHKAANEAGDAESKAKNLDPILEDLKPQKDAICYFGMPLSWTDFDNSAQLMDKMIDWQKDMGNRSLTGFLRKTTGEFEKDKRKKYGRWRWRAAYQLKRMISRKDKIIGEELAQFGSWLFTGSFNGNDFKRTENNELIDVVPFLTRWIQNLTHNS